MLLAVGIVAIGLLLCVGTWTCSDQWVNNNDVEYVDTAAIPEAPVDISDELPAEGESDVMIDSDVEPEAVAPQE